MKWFKRIFGNSKKKQQSSGPGFLCSQCMVSHDAGSVVILPWWNESVEDFTTTYRCLLCLPGAMEESKNQVKKWDSDISRKLSDFLVRHGLEALAETFSKSESSEEAMKHFTSFLSAIENWQIRLRPSGAREESLARLSPDADPESNESIAKMLASFDWEAADSLFLSAPKHLGQIEDRSEPAIEMMFDALSMANSAWEEGEHADAIATLEGFRQFQRQRRRLFKEDTFPLLFSLGTAYRTLEQYDKAAEVFWEAGRADPHPSISDAQRFAALIKAAGSYCRVAEDGIAREALIAASPLATRLFPPNDDSIVDDLATYLALSLLVGEVLDAIGLARRVVGVKPDRGFARDAYEDLLAHARMVIDPPRRPSPIDKLRSTFELELKKSGTYTHDVLESLFLYVQELVIRKQFDRAAAEVDICLQKVTTDIAPAAFKLLMKLSDVMSHHSTENAEKIYHTILNRSIDLCGRDSVETATIMAELAGFMLNNANLPFLESEVLSQEFAETARAPLGLLQGACSILESFQPDSDLTLAAKNNLAIALMSSHQFSEAVVVFRSLIGPFSSKYGEKHANTLGLLASFARALEFNGELEEASNQFLVVCQYRDQTLGEMHPDSIRSWANLGTVESKRGNEELALEYFNRSLERETQVYGSSSVPVSDTLQSISCALFKLGRQTEAIEVSQRALEIGFANPGIEPIIMATLIENFFAIKTRGLGSAEHAVTLSELREQYLAHSNGNIDQWLRIVFELGNKQCQLDQIDSAIFVLRDLLQQTEAHQAWGVNPSLFVGGRLADLLCQQQQFSQAISLMEDLCEKGKQLGHEDRFNFLSARQQLATAYMQAGEMDKSIILLKALAEEIRTVDYTGKEEMLAHQWKVADSLCKAYLLNGQAEEAVANFEQVLNMQIEQLGKAADETLMTVAFLVRIHSKLGNHQRCDELIAEFNLESGSIAQDSNFDGDNAGEEAS